MQIRDTKFTRLHCSVFSKYNTRRESVRCFFSGADGFAESIIVDRDAAASPAGDGVVLVANGDRASSADGPKRPVDYDRQPGGKSLGSRGQLARPTPGRRRRRRHGR